MFSRVFRTFFLFVFVGGGVGCYRGVRGLCGYADRFVSIGNSIR